MKYIPGDNRLTKTWVAVSTGTLLTATLAFGRVEPTNKTFTAGEKAKVTGVVISHDGDTIKLRAADNSVETVDLTNSTKIEMKHGWFGHKTMEASEVVPGLQLDAEGKGNDKGDLVASKITFDKNSSRASRQIDTRVSPLEARAGSLEGRAGKLEGRADTLDQRTNQLDTRANNLETTEKQTQQQVGEVKTTADQANQGVNSVNGRVSNLDNYQTKDTATVYFRVNSSVLTPQAKKDLDDLATKAKNAKGYVLEIAGFADKTGNSALNQQLSRRRADAVTQYLQEYGDIPIHRILPAAGLGTTHEAADNRTAQGRKLNRRVEVKLLVNQGLVADQGPAASSQTSTVNSNSAPATASTPASTTGTTAPPQQ